MMITASGSSEGEKAGLKGSEDGRWGREVIIRKKSPEIFPPGPRVWDPANIYRSTGLPTTYFGVVDDSGPARFPEGFFGSGGIFRTGSFMDCDLTVGKKWIRSHIKRCKEDPETGVNEELDEVLRDIFGQGLPSEAPPYYPLGVPWANGYEAIASVLEYKTRPFEACQRTSCLQQIAADSKLKGQNIVSVSYTHLTLPTKA